jgi:hypothetical protein
MRPFLSAVLLAACSAALGGALVFHWQRTRSPEELQNRLDEASTKLAAAESQIFGLLEEKRDLELRLREGEECGELRSGPATGTEPYVDEAHGIALILPYSETWGYGAEQDAVPLISPYLPMTEVDGIQFGPPYEIGPCAFAHSIQLTFIPARGSGAIIAERQAAQALPVGDDGHIAFRYPASSGCAEYHIEVVGPRFNYVFSACPEGTAALPGTLDSLELLE